MFFLCSHRRYETSRGKCCGGNSRCAGMGAFRHHRARPSPPAGCCPRVGEDHHRRHGRPIGAGAGTSISVAAVTWAAGQKAASVALRISSRPPLGIRPSNRCAPAAIARPSIPTGYGGASSAKCGTIVSGRLARNFGVRDARRERGSAFGQSGSIWSNPGPMTSGSPCRKNGNGSAL